MKESKALTFVCFACGLSFVSGEHSVDACLRGEWCNPPPIHMPDLPHKHPLPTDTGSGLKMAVTSTSATWSRTTLHPPWTRR
jgi:hypothetical protein